MEWLNEWLEWLSEWLVSVFLGFAGWLLLLIQDFTSWSLSFLHSSWPAGADMIGVVIHNHELIAIWLGSSVLIVASGFLGCTIAFRHFDRKASAGNEENIDMDSEDKRDDSIPDSN